MTRRKKTPPENKPLEQYTHTDKDRAYNPPVGLVTPDTDREAGKKQYQYDPHLDPQLQWTGKAERTSFEVPTVSLHVHERIDPRTIVEAVRKKEEELQPSLFEKAELPLRQAIEFYKHRQNWTNRLIAGDSLLVMNSLLVKEGMAGQVQMIYLDPPYGIKYGSNFQPFVNKRDVKDGKDEDLTQEPETLKAFRDTWELGIHSYLTYLRDRLLLARELLHESGSIFVQISDENVHLIKNLMDETFGAKNFVALVTVQKTTGATNLFLAGVADYVIWYGKQVEKLKYRPIYKLKEIGGAGAEHYKHVELPDGTRRAATQEELDNSSLLPKGTRFFTAGDLQSASMGREKGIGAACWFPVEYEGKTYLPNEKNRWKTNEEGIARLKAAKRVIGQKNALRYVRYFDDFPAYSLNNVWADLGGASDKVYVVQTSEKAIQRCLIMTTDPGDLVLDPTCGSGTTAYVAEQWGRRWITCDTSRVAITLAKQRLMTANFDYYELAKTHEGVSSGFRYKTVPHVTLKSIANNEPPAMETLYDRPLIDSNKLRVTSPFTVEAVPAPTVQALSEVEIAATEADASIARSGETVRQAELRDELLRTGIRGRKGGKLMFSRVEPLSGPRFLHADAEIVLGDKSSEDASLAIATVGGGGGLAGSLLVLVLSTTRSGRCRLPARLKRLTGYSLNRNSSSSRPINSTPKRLRTSKR